MVKLEMYHKKVAVTSVEYIWASDTGQRRICRLEKETTAILTINLTPYRYMSAEVFHLDYSGVLSAWTFAHDQANLGLGNRMQLQVRRSSKSYELSGIEPPSWMDRIDIALLNHRCAEVVMIFGLRKLMRTLCA
jgi:hypothetical protein